jgi:hypothetical protein
MLHLHQHHESLSDLSFIICWLPTPFHLHIVLFQICHYFGCHSQQRVIRCHVVCYDAIPDRWVCWALAAAMAAAVAAAFWVWSRIRFSNAWYAYHHYARVTKERMTKPQSVQVTGRHAQGGAL